MHLSSLHHSYVFVSPARCLSVKLTLLPTPPSAPCCAAFASASAWSSLSSMVMATRSPWLNFSSASRIFSITRSCCSAAASDFTDACLVLPQSGMSLPSVPGSGSSSACWLVSLAVPAPSMESACASDCVTIHPCCIASLAERRDCGLFWSRPMSRSNWSPLMRSCLASRLVKRSWTLAKGNLEVIMHHRITPTAQTSTLCEYDRATSSGAQYSCVPTMSLRNTPSSRWRAVLRSVRTTLKSRRLKVVPSTK
mmetsp:Transcript_43035/g.133787  ORF Transcript_43035/g.133787 Transcript_43035/m.133787 type:complete len:252 (-) Transcript_43035:556-1311(-)